MYDDDPEEFDSDGGDLGQYQDRARDAAAWGCLALLGLGAVVGLALALEAIRKGIGP